MAFMALRRDGFLKPLLKLHRGYRSTVFRGAVAAAADSHPGNQASNELMELEEKYSAHKYVPCFLIRPVCQCWYHQLIVYRIDALAVVTKHMLQGPSAGRIYTWPCQNLSHFPPE